MAVIIKRIGVLVWVEEKAKSRILREVANEIRGTVRFGTEGAGIFFNRLMHRDLNCFRMPRLQSWIGPWTLSDLRYIYASSLRTGAEMPTNFWSVEQSLSVEKVRLSWIILAQANVDDKKNYE